MPNVAAPSRRAKASSQRPAATDITSYNSAVRYLTSAVNYERMRLVRYSEDTFKLDRRRSLMDALGNPHEQSRLVHAAGTVGKGSTVAMVASMLRGCGYAVGEYTSPHLVDMRERIRINDQLIPKTEVTELTKRLAAAIGSAGIEPTFFEMMTALAFCHFADRAVDIAVIETGLGGRLDSTNVITPEVSVITRIDRDHTHLLGRTLPEIAREKAGIMKRGVPALTCPQEPAVDAVLRLRFGVEQAAPECRHGLRVRHRQLDSIDARQHPPLPLIHCYVGVCWFMA